MDIGKVVVAELHENSRHLDSKEIANSAPLGLERIAHSLEGQLPQPATNARVEVNLFSGEFGLEVIFFSR